jgi:hypothetical protein
VDLREIISTIRISGLPQPRQPRPATGWQAPKDALLFDGRQSGSLVNAVMLTQRNQAKQPRSIKFIDSHAGHQNLSS